MSNVLIGIIGVILFIGLALAGNVRQAWHSPAAVTFGQAKEIVPDDVRRLARRILKAVAARHRRPSWKGLPVQLDQREVTLLPARKATQGGRVTHWLRIVAAGVGKAEVPLIGTPPFLARKGPRANTVQISRSHDGVLAFGVVTDITDACATSRAGYRPKIGTLTLDFGLTRLFATDRGDLLGRDFLDRLVVIDRTIDGIARHAQRAGTKLRDSARYRHHVARLRGLIRTEINRVLNRLVEMHAPSDLLLERLDFSNPALSCRMNRLVSNCGRSVVAAKLADLEQRFGIASEEVDPAYTSQRCSSCGHVHRSNRNGDVFQCCRCGLTLHADVNAARNIRQRRSLPAPDEALLRPGSTLRPLRGRRRTLEALRQDFERRHPDHRLRRWPGCRSRGRGPAADSQGEPLRFALGRGASHRLTAVQRQSDDGFQPVNPENHYEFGTIPVAFTNLSYNSQDKAICEAIQRQLTGNATVPVQSGNVIPGKAGCFTNSARDTYTVYERI